MMRIMFVCHGNICRSPMAEFIFKKMLNDRGLSEEFFVVSSATSTEEIWHGIGNPVYPPAVAELEKHGITAHGKRAVQLRSTDIDKYDMFVGMDSANIRNMKRILGDGSEDKVYKLLEFTTDGGDVADPWYSDRFDIAYADIYRGCEALLEYILRDKKNGN